MKNELLIFMKWGPSLSEALTLFSQLKEDTFSKGDRYFFQKTIKALFEIEVSPANSTFVYFMSDQIASLRKMSIQYIILECYPSDGGASHQLDLIILSILNSINVCTNW